MSVDATASRLGRLTAVMTIPVRSGPLRLAYPKWVPGQHMPVGPVADIAGLRISVSGRSIAWTRDPVEMFVFQCDVPPGADSIQVELSYLPRSKATSSLGLSSISENLLMLNWNELLLYPDGVPSDSIVVSPSLRLPKGWRYGTALMFQKEGGGVVRFADVSLTTLVDSPVLAGRFFKSIDLGPEATPKHYLDIAADSPGALAVPDSTVVELRKMVRETLALFGSTHYRQYRFLLALSNELGEDGLEHHESSDDRKPEDLFTDGARLRTSMRLLPHEFVHSWNGKYKRPAGLATADYLTPMRGDLLWIYEGLTRYLEWILSTRSGLFSPENARGYLAMIAAKFDHRSGREWRSLEDTAVAVQLLARDRGDSDSFRRTADYYDESLFIWLEADTIIRNVTRGQRSLDDFCRSFFGGVSGSPIVEPYTLDNILAALSSVAPYDWKGFFESRVYRTGTEHAPLDGLIASGWRLAYQHSRTAFQADFDPTHKAVDAAYSLGLRLRDDGTTADVLSHSVAMDAGMAPLMQIVSVNGRQWSGPLLRSAIQAASQTEAPIELIARKGEFFFNFHLNYHQGERYPFLEATTGRDVMADILRARTQP